MNKAIEYDAIELPMVGNNSSMILSTGWKYRRINDTLARRIPPSTCRVRKIELMTTTYLKKMNYSFQPLQAARVVNRLVNREYYNIIFIMIRIYILILSLEYPFNHVGLDIYIYTSPHAPPFTYVDIAWEIVLISVDYCCNTYI